jgi:uncharacterized membrane protein YfcA
MDHTGARALGRLFWRYIAGIAGSWAGILALITLSVVWPSNHVPQSLLAVWALATLASVAAAWRKEKKPNGRGARYLFVVAPIHPLARAGVAIRAVGRTRRKRS